MRLLRLLFWVLCLGLVATPAAAHAQVGCAAARQFDLTALPDAASEITASAARTATPDQAAACVIDGYTNRAIGWRLFLPERWNGKLVQEGCGGRCGALRDMGCTMLIQRGFACIAADLGHAGSNFDSVWAIGNPVAQMDTAFRATHVANLVARVVVARFYGKPTEHVYYTAVSAGGRQGLISAQRYPDDFDGIIVGGPAMTRGPAFDRFPTVMAWASGLLAPGGKVLVPAPAIRALHAAALAACDTADGLADGIVSLPYACHFDPDAIACATVAAPCLNPDQIAAVRALYTGMPAKDGLKPDIAFLPGSELAWIGDYVTEGGGPGVRAPSAPAATPAYESVLMYSADPDLRAFAALGHKLIVFQGLADTITPPARTIDYMQQVARALGGQAEAAIRFYLVPGMAHEPGKMSAEAVDWIGLLDSWVVHDDPPETITGMHLRDTSHMLGPTLPLADLAPANVDFERPLYRFPMVAVYRTGDPAKATSFVPRPALATEKR